MYAELLECPIGRYRLFFRPSRSRNNLAPPLVFHHRAPDTPSSSAPSLPCHPRPLLFLPRWPLSLVLARLRHILLGPMLRPTPSISLSKTTRKTFMSQSACPNDDAQWTGPLSRIVPAPQTHHPPHTVTSPLQDSPQLCLILVLRRTRPMVPRTRRLAREHHSLLHPHRTTVTTTRTIL